jgi:glycosyltransferase involved in cell wall biosynthesis
MSEERPSVAVAVATYNHAHFLGAAIDSVLAQTVQAAEILVVDDGSNDAPETVVARYPQVRIVRQANAGLSAARNTGFRETSSPLIQFLDADDRLSPRAIETGLASLALDPEAAFTYGAYRIVEVLAGSETDVQFNPVPREAFGAFLRGNEIGMHGTVLYRREPLERSGGFAVNLRACEDYDMYLRLSLDHPVLCHDDICADYFFHDSNMSRDPGFMLQAALTVLRQYRGEAERRGLLDDYRTGVEEWKRHYVDVWGGVLRRRPREAFGSGLALARLAPKKVARKLLSAGRRVIGSR